MGGSIRKPICLDENESLCSSGPECYDVTSMDNPILCVDATSGTAQKQLQAAQFE
jgi:hypothetical protein